MPIQQDLDQLHNCSIDTDPMFSIKKILCMHLSFNNKILTAYLYIHNGFSRIDHQIKIDPDHSENAVVEVSFHQLRAKKSFTLLLLDSN